MSAECQLSVRFTFNFEISKLRNFFSKENFRVTEKHRRLAEKRKEERGPS